MAKGKSDFRDEFEATTPLPVVRAPEPAVATDPEKEALRARITELESLLRPMADRLEQLEDLIRKGPPAVSLPAVEPTPHPAVLRPEGGYWKVELEYGPTHVVQAVDQANAWSVYKAELGVIASEHSPVVTGAGREEYRAAQAKRHGKRPEEWRLPDDP